MKIGELLDRWIFCVLAPLESVAQKNAHAVPEVPPVKFATVLFDKNTLRIGEVGTQLFGPDFGLAESCVHKDRAVAPVFFIDGEGIVDGHAVLEQDAGRNAAFRGEAFLEQFRDVCTVSGVLAEVGIHDDNRSTLCGTDRVERALQSAQSPFNRLDDGYETRLGQ